MKQLSYPKESKKWVKVYDLSMPDWNKSLIFNAFKVIGKKNTKYIIFVAIDAYGMGIDNLDI